MKKPDWMTEGAWRALRTAWQTFLGVFVVALYGVVVAYADEPHIFDFHTLYYGGGIMGVASIIAWWMNRKG
jgi:hypothetical protein